MRVIAGLSKPEGLGYHPPTDALSVANGGDGTAAIFRGDDYRAITRIPLGKDADNVRMDTVGNRVFVAYGDGTLAVIDPTSRSKVADIELKAHPESFQVDHRTSRIFVNDPANQAIVVVHRPAGKARASWPTARGTHFPPPFN